MVSIEGNIGSGKSTILSALEGIIKDYQQDIMCIPEPVGDWTPILTKFYQDQKRYSFATGIRVLLSYQNKNKFLGNISERSPFAGRYIFTALHEQDDMIDPVELDIYKQAYVQMGWQPDLVFYVKTPPEVCADRAAQRARDCESTLTLEYLQRLHDMHETALKDQYTGRLLVELDGTDDPKTNAMGIFQVINTIRRLGDLVVTPPLGHQAFYRLAPDPSFPTP